ncbi:hypothetical protein BAUCODRAFT_556959 [Baudoinia panamericana UAMH 10762]|uniref:Uncharacterized protein n=1 Tax=Baudoinia panamericana (strain UAMH 10762) TaxID=717646 RepID=M2N6M7_BAUPA|nr:uncharacterized protein BAUCODRAFT_556959 [Baudoinia panamericana UAMH 10762]EMC94719.1 hypothetical protein BAUCODRAFT_556959 [Baudoinia panamericana UAMH 10762]
MTMHLPRVFRTQIQLKWVDVRHTSRHSRRMARGRYKDVGQDTEDRIHQLCPLTQQACLQTLTITNRLSRQLRMHGNIHGHVESLSLAVQSPVPQTTVRVAQNLAKSSSKKQCLRTTKLSN